ncbi:hypothetical protein JHK85_015530 [Glycine max]|nr:hypothetical protein JHK85_015530 [Glycine max]KAG5045766.1 hypothetical protein JHK86_015172 [Glycine max]
MGPSWDSVVMCKRHKIHTADPGVTNGASVTPPPPPSLTHFMHFLNWAGSDLNVPDENIQDITEFRDAHSPHPLSVLSVVSDMGFVFVSDRDFPNLDNVPHTFTSSFSFAQLNHTHK